MKTTKSIGIWMDHEIANLMEFTSELVESTVIHSKFTHQVKEDSLKKSEHLMNHKEQQQQEAYYNELAEILKNYNQVLLFGPTDAKIELHNILKSNHHFDKITIEVQSTGKMTENQQHAYVKQYFHNK